MSIMKRFFKSPFFAPLQTSKNYAFFWISIIVLMTIKIYEGDQSFFVRHFGDHYSNTEWLNWAKWGWHHGASLLLFFIIPAIIVKKVFKQPLSNFGLAIGDWKFGLTMTGVALIVMPFLVYRASINPHHHEFYASSFPVHLATSSSMYFMLWAITYLPHYIGWEFFFRGYIGFGVKKEHGAFIAIMLQSLLTTLMHIGKPEGETWGAAIGGIYFGLLTYRTNSILYAVLFHLYIGLLNTWFCSF